MRLGSLALVALAGCGSAPPAPPIPTPAATVAKSPPVAALPPVVDVAPADPLAQICWRRPGCIVHRERAAGTDAAGRRLAVLTIDTGIHAENEGHPVPPDASGVGLTETDHEDTTAPITDGACHGYEHWIVVREGDRVISAAAVTRLCNAVYGASGGEDRITVGENSLVFERDSGSAWRGRSRFTLSLSPLRVRRIDRDLYWTNGLNVEHAIWDQDAFAGHTDWSSPPCDATGAPRVSPGSKGGPDARRDSAQEYLTIPTVDLDPDFLGTGWKTTALGRCGALADATGAHGFVTFGKPGAASDASMRVVASRGGELFVEVRDDVRTGPSARWVADDHLEVWAGSERVSYFDPCWPDPHRAAEKPVQWGVRLADGQVFSGEGKPDPAALHVEKVDVSSGVSRLRIKLPPGFAGVTIACSDGDDGHTQERLIATSRLVFGKAETLGSLGAMMPEKAACRASGGELAPIDAPYDPQQLDLSP